MTATAPETSDQRIPAGAPVSISPMPSGRRCCRWAVTPDGRRCAPSGRWSRPIRGPVRVGVP